VPVKRRFLVVASLLAAAVMPRPAAAYVDLSPTIGKVIGDSRTIALVEVVNLDRQKHTLTLRERTVLKGKAGETPLIEQVAESDQADIPRSIVQWAEPGAQGIVFSTARTAIVCIGQSWYQLRLAGDQWKLGLDRPELTLTYYGSVSRLATGLQRMLAGGDAVLTVVPHGDAENVGFDLALNRMAYPALVKVQRIRANLKMPGTVFMVSSNPAYVVGLGPVDETELPSVVSALQTGDATARAAAAEDIRQLTEMLGAARTRAALPALEGCLGNSSPQVRCLAAGTILRITHGHEKALRVLKEGLSSADWMTRRDATKAAAVTGRAGEPLVPMLAGLLNDPDEGVRWAALEAIGTLGPVAAGARDEVAALLDSPDEMIGAADALGRMGPRAQPVPAKMVAMLQSDQTEVRLAALRGMSQIGGKESLPAAEYIASHIADVAEIDAYNMVEYLALMGPIASGPAARIRTVPMPNYAVSQAANWAMNAPSGIPWLGGGSDMLGSIGDSVYAGFVAALGERLRPCALALAPRVIKGTAGSVPDWGYRILNAAPEESIRTIAPHLKDTDKTVRERAAVALGRMGPGAAGAKTQVEAAMAQAQDTREKNLLAWCLHAITAD